MISSERFFEYRIGVCPVSVFMRGLNSRAEKAKSGLKEFRRDGWRGLVGRTMNEAKTRQVGAKCSVGMGMLVMLIQEAGTLVGRRVLRNIVREYPAENRFIEATSDPVHCRRFKMVRPRNANEANHIRGAPAWRRGVATSHLFVFGFAQEQESAKVRACALTSNDYLLPVATKSVSVVEDPADSAVDVLKHAVNPRLWAIAVVRRDDHDALG